MNKQEMNDWLVRNKGLVYEIVLKYRKSSESDFDDVLAAGFDGAFYAMTSYSPDKNASLNTWVTYNIRWSILNHLNRITKQQDQLETISLDSLEDIDKTSYIEEQYVEPLIDIDVNHMVNLKSLTPKQHDVMDAVYRRGLRLKHFAQERGVSRETVSFMHKRAIAKVREEFYGAH